MLRDKDGFYLATMTDTRLYYRRNNNGELTDALPTHFGNISDAMSAAVMDGFQVTTNRY